MKKRSNIVKIFGIGAVALLVATAFAPVLSAGDPDDDGGIVLQTLLQYKADLLAIADSVQDYLDVYGTLEGYELPQYLEDQYNLLVDNLTQIMNEGLDNYYYDDYWTSTGNTWLDYVFEYQDSSWRRVGDDWENDTQHDRIIRTWGRELVMGDTHLLYFGLTIFSPTEATNEIFWMIPFPDNRGGDGGGMILDKKSRGGYFSGKARVDVTLTDGTEMTIYVDDPADLADQLSQIEGDIQQIDIYDHGTPGAQWCGDDDLLIPTSDEWEDITDEIVEDGTVVLHGCNVASDEDPVMDDYLQDLADEGDVTVKAWTGKTWYVPLPWGFTWYIETGDEVTVDPQNNNNGNCFLAGTLVSTADGKTKTIEDIEVGDIVQSYNLFLNEMIPARVTRVFHHPPKQMGEYYLIINDEIRVTPNHIMLVNGKLTPIGKATIGDSLGVLEEKAAISSIIKVDEEEWSYNFEIVPFDGTGMTGWHGYGGDSYSMYWGMSMYVLYGYAVAAFLKNLNNYEAYYCNQYYWYY